MRKNSVRQKVQDVVDIRTAECTGKKHLLYFNKVHHMIQGSWKEHSHVSWTEQGRNFCLEINQQGFMSVSNGSKKSRASRRGRKCQGSISGCWRFPEVSKNIRKLQNGAGRLRRFGRVLSSETRKVQESYEEEFRQVEGARRSRYSNCRMYRKEASFIL